MRSAEFDREKVLRAAITAFMTKGYSKTSMQDLKKATGLHPGSIYCAFNNKQGLLLAALEQYNEDKANEFTHYFAGNKQLLVGVKNYLNCTVSACTQDGPQRNCLSQKALNELAEQAPLVEQVIANNMKQWQERFVAIFEQALLNGEINSSRSPKQRVQSLVMGIYGLRTYAQTHPEAEVLNELASQLFDDVTR